jgi:hypothetical protein
MGGVAMVLEKAEEQQQDGRTWRTEEPKMKQKAELACPSLLDFKYRKSQNSSFYYSAVEPRDIVFFIVSAGWGD